MLYWYACVVVCCGEYTQNMYRYTCVLIYIILINIKYKVVYNGIFIMYHNYYHIHIQIVHIHAQIHSTYKRHISIDTPTMTQS